MSRYYFLLAIALIVGIGGQVGAQDHPPARYCGVQMGRSAWLQKYQSAPDLYRKGSDTTLYVPLTIHIVGDDNGNGYFSRGALLRALCRLNEDYEQANIHFFVEGDIRYINSSVYYNHTSVLQGAEMMFANNVANTLNCYFVNDPAGNCGYNLPYAGIAMRKSCSQPTDHTWAHEVGHALKLPHPFLGWEGGVSWDGSVSHNFNNPAPLRVTYDYTFFKDTLILDTLIIDTAYVEWVDGSNCSFAADGFCDTSPDYLAARWTCDNNGSSPTLQRDPAGVAFRSDGSYIMGYANDACQAAFTPEQRAAMRAYLLDQRANWLYNQLVPGMLDTSEPVSIIAPAPGEPVVPNAAYLAWSPIANATHYLVEISRLASFSAPVTTEYITDAPSLNIPVNLLENRTYFWRIKPFSAYHHCSDWRVSSSFLTGTISGLQEPGGLVAWQLSPNPIAAGGQLLLDISLDSLPAESWHLQLSNSLGQVVFSQLLRPGSGQQQLAIELPAALPAGIYSFTLGDTYGQVVKRLVIQ